MKTNFLKYNLDRHMKVCGRRRARQGILCAEFEKKITVVKQFYNRNPIIRATNVRPVKVQMCGCCTLLLSPA